MCAGVVGTCRCFTLTVSAIAPHNDRCRFYRGPAQVPKLPSFQRTSRGWVQGPPYVTRLRAAEKKCHWTILRVRLLRTPFNNFFVQRERDRFTLRQIPLRPPCIDSEPSGSDLVETYEVLAPTAPTFERPKAPSSPSRSPQHPTFQVALRAQRGASVLTARISTTVITIRTNAAVFIFGVEGSPSSSCERILKWVSAGKYL